MSIDYLSPQFIIPFLIVLAVLGVRVHYKATWKTVHRPFLVIISILSVALIIIMLYAASVSYTHLDVYKRQVLVRLHSSCTPIWNMPAPAV